MHGISMSSPDQTGRSNQVRKNQLHLFSQILAMFLGINPCLAHPKTMPILPFSQEGSVLLVCKLISLDRLKELGKVEPSLQDP